MPRSTFIFVLVILLTVLLCLVSCNPLQQPVSCAQLSADINRLLQLDVPLSEVETFITNTYEVSYQQAGNSLLWESEGTTYEARFVGNQLEMVFIEIEKKLIDGETVVDCFGVPSHYKADISVGHHSSIFEFNLFYEDQGMLFRSYEAIRVAQGLPDISSRTEFNSIWLLYLDNDDQWENEIAQNYKAWISWETIDIQIDPALEQLLP
jgi:hypothetical protein